MVHLLESYLQKSARPIGFAKCNHTGFTTTKGKIYPYYEIVEAENGSDYVITIKDDYAKLSAWYMDSPRMPHIFVFYHYPEFPKDTSQWTENDWFQYDLKYGE